MIAVALKGLAGRKVRALLTAFAVVIGVSMVSGTFILTDTMQKTFDGLFAASYEETDAVIAGKQIVETSTSASATIPASLLDRVEALPEVGAAAGAVMPQEVNAADILGRDGKAVANESLGASVDAGEPALQPVRAQVGRLARRPAAGRDRRRHGEEGRLRGRRHASRWPRPAARRPTRSPAPPASARSTRSASAASPSGTSRPRSPCSTARAATTRSRSPRARARRRASSCARCSRSSRALEVKDSAEQAEEASAQIDKGMAYHPLLPARLRRHRAVRRRVRDLQHALDHRRPAHARVRDAAHARRLAQAGAALRPARGARDRAARLDDRALPRLRDRQGHARAVQRAGRRPARRPTRCSRSGR